ncbi:MAG: phosphoribosylamine--glycine ligase [Cytophagales bacterium]|nr:phosphoribosylamine--glycine ligase [Armatimonadota bacterium]
MKILVVGGGGREHALCWKLAQSQEVHKIYCAPGNAGTALVAENVRIAADDIDNLVLFADHQNVDLTVVGPERPLLLGIVDAFEARGLRIFGPSREPAMLEGSKAFSKEIMRRAGIPTGDFAVFEDTGKARDYLKAQTFPIVVKADGEAGGKGVVVAQDFAEADSAIRRFMEERIFGASGDKVVIEQCLFGEEASVMAFVDGETVIPMTAVQDHKRALDGDLGPNTGGMGAYAPVPAAPLAVVEEVTRRILRPAVEAVRGTGIPYRGILYAGVMLTDAGPMCLEFNCRFGDPETQVVLPLLTSDLASIFSAAVDAELETVPVKFAHRSALTVVLASGGYPGDYEVGKPITGLDAASKLDAVAVFHAGTRKNDEGQVVTTGGRVLSITATGETFAEARERCYAGVRRIQFEEMQYRTDIGYRAL